MPLFVQYAIPSAAWYPILAVGLSMVGFISIKSGRDAVFFSQGGLTQLPVAYIWIALASILAAVVHLAAMRRWGARRTRSGVILLTGLACLAWTPFVDAQHPLLVMALFIFIPVIFAAVFAAAWLLAADLLAGQEAGDVGRIYAWIGAASMLGGIAGGVLANGLSRLVEPRFLVAGGGLVLLLAAAVVASAHRRHPLGKNPSTPKGRPQPSSRPQSELLKQPYIRAMAGISALGAIAALFIDFQFYAIATLSGHSSAHFFSAFYAILNLAALALQLLAAPWLQSRIGIGGALFVLPAALVGGAGMVALSATLFSRAALKAAEGGIKASIHRSVWEQVYLPIDRSMRDQARVLVDGAAPRIAEGVGGALLLLWLSQVNLGAGSDLNWLAWAILAALLIWMALVSFLVRKGCSDVDGREGVIRLPDS